MFKRSCRIFVFIFLSGISFAVAQSADTTKKDSIKIDTNLLNKFRLEPRKNELPVRTRPVLITAELIPVTLPDYKYSYWHKNVLFNLNFSQAAFSRNWTGGGVSSVALNSNFDFKAEYNKSPNFSTYALVPVQQSKHLYWIQRYIIMSLIITV
jgi:hypothetical protein